MLYLCLGSCVRVCICVCHGGQGSVRVRVWIDPAALSTRRVRSSRGSGRQRNPRRQQHKKTTPLQPPRTTFMTLSQKWQATQRQRERLSQSQREGGPTRKEKDNLKPAWSRLVLFYRPHHYLLLTTCYTTYR